MNALFALTLAMVVFGLMDWYSTRKILENGGRELNPIAKAGMDLLGVDGYLAAKAVVATGLTYFAGMQNIWLAVVVAAVYTAAMIWNWKSL